MNDKLCQIKEKGTLVCASAGNDSIDVENQVPACFDSVITVTAMNRFKHFESYSNYGSNVDFIAPGTDITSASNTTSWGVQCLSGTSMANPHVAAAVAMLASDSKANYTAQQIETILKTRCAVDLGVEGKDDYYGYGYINLKRLIEEDASTDNAETFHVYFGVDYESYDQDIYSATSIHVGYSLDGTSKSFDITKEADKTINTSNGFNCIIKLGNGYEFIGWYVGSNSNGSNSLLGYNNASCYSTDDNIIITPDMEKNLYIIAKVKKRVLDVQIVINFQNVDEIDGYMGYGCNFIFRSAKVNCIDENKRNVMFDNPQTGVYSSTPRVMTYKFNNIPVGSTYYLRLYLDLDEAKISSVYADGVKKYVSKVTPLPYDDDNREEEQSYQSGLNESNFTTYEVMGSVNISSHLVESYVIAINILV